MKKEKLLAKAIYLTAEAFKDKTDKGGQPYVLHCLEVMNGVKHLGEDAMICAVMHDILEDCPNITESWLRSEGFNYHIDILKLLTHKEGVSYDDYIKSISLNKVATSIKLADLKHNSNITRLKGLSKKDFDRMEKYCKAYTYLKEV